MHIDKTGVNRFTFGKCSRNPIIKKMPCTDDILSGCLISRAEQLNGSLSGTGIGIARDRGNADRCAALFAVRLNPGPDPGCHGICCQDQ